MFKKIFNRLYPILFGKIRFARKIGVKVGDDCRIYIKDWGSEPFLINIGDNVTIAPNTRIINHDGSLWLFRNKHGRYYNYKSVSVGNNVFIGINCTILPGVNICDNVIVGAGSVVTKDLESGFIYAGNPAKKIKSIDEFKERFEKESIHSSDLNNEIGNYKQRILKCLMEKK